MTAVEETRQETQEFAEQMVGLERGRAHVRAFELPLEKGWDGRTLDVTVVPYNQVGVVADPPDWQPYREMFLPGAFQRQLQTPGRDKVFLNFEHEQGIRGVVGHSLRFRDGADGLDASFGIHDNADGDKALQMIHDGLLTGLSLEFHELASRRGAGGVVERVRAQLDKVALCRYPAYRGSQVLAVRCEATEAGSQCVKDDGHDGGHEWADAAAFTEFTVTGWEPTSTSSVTAAATTNPAPVAVPPQPPALERSSDVDEQLAALGFEPLQRIAKTSKPWDGSPGRFTDEQYRASTLFCRPGDGPVKERCSLPVLEPDGTLNTNALGAAAGALAGARGGVGNASLALKAAAARKLVRYYNQVGMDVPVNLRQIAGSG